MLQTPLRQCQQNLDEQKKKQKTRKKKRELSNTSQPSRRSARKAPARWRTPAGRGWEGELRLPGTCQGMGRHGKKRDGLRFNHGHGGGRRTSPCHTMLTAKLCSSLSPHRHPSASAKPTCGSGKTQHGGSPTGPEAPGATIGGGGTWPLSFSHHAKNLEGKRRGYRNRSQRLFPNQRRGAVARFGSGETQRGVITGWLRNSSHPNRAQGDTTTIF